MLVVAGAAETRQDGWRHKIGLAEVIILILDLGRPVLGEHVFQASADSVAIMMAAVERERLRHGEERQRLVVVGVGIAAGKIAPRAFPPQSVYAPKSSAPRLSARCREAPTVPRIRLRKLYIRYKECCRTGSLLTYLDPQLPF